MQTRGVDAIPLPPRPNLEQYKKHAKDLAKACRAGTSDAIRGWAAHWLAALGRLQSPANSPELNDANIDSEVDSIEADARRSKLLEAEHAAASCTITNAQLFIARLHGFESWPKFSQHITALSRAASPISQFELAVDAVVAGDIATLGSLLRSNPALVRARSTRDHRATLLHYIAANGHETYRQKTPANAVDVAEVLLRAGAEVDALANMYNYDCTTMDMLVSSTPPAAARLQVPLAETLLDFGAAINGVLDDSSPLLTALGFEYPDAAQALARRGARIDNILTAAGLGRADLVKEFVDENGNLEPGVPLAAVRWPNLPKEPRAHLNLALIWAAMYGHAAVVELLLDRGLNPATVHADGQKLTALHWAAAYGHMDIIGILLRHGAQLEVKNNYGGTVLDSTLWFAFNAPRQGADYGAVVQMLIDAGARTDLYPAMRQYIDEVLRRRATD